MSEIKEEQQQENLEQTTRNESQTEISEEQILNFLEANEKGKSIIQKATDQRVSKGIETWKNNNLDKLVNERYNELHPPETEAERKLREANERIDRIEREAKRKDLLIQANKTASSLGLPIDLVDTLIADDVETTNAKIKTVNEAIQKEVNRQVAERLKGVGQSAPTNTEESTEQKSLQDQIKEAERNRDHLKALELKKQLRSRVF